MVEVEATHQVLIGLAFAAMGGDHEPRDGLEQLARPVRRRERKLVVDDNALAGGSRSADQATPLARHDHFLDIDAHFIRRRRWAYHDFRGGRLIGSLCERL